MRILPEFSRANAGALLGAVGLLMASSSIVHASPCTHCFAPESSHLVIRFSGLPKISITSKADGWWSGSSDAVWYRVPGSPYVDFVGANSVWSTINFGPGTALFTGVPLISHVRLTAMNEFGTMQGGFSTTANPMSNSALGAIGPTFGGNIRLSGRAVIEALGVRVPVGLEHVGGVFGETTSAVLPGFLTVRAEHGPFVTHSVAITKITTNLISIPGRAGVKTGAGFTLQPTTNEFIRTFNTTGGFQSISGGSPAVLHTVTVSGTPFPEVTNLTWQAPVTVVSPIRIDTGSIAGVIPGAVELQFMFVPEPGSSMLLAVGAVALVVLARRRMRSR